MNNFFFIILLILIQFKCCSQNNVFFKNIKTLDLPMLIDEISFANLNSFEEIEYSKIKNILKSKDSNFYISDTFKNTKYYLCGKYNLEDKTALIVIIDSPSIKSIACYLMIYSKEFELLNFTLIANKLIADKNSKFSSCIINLNNLIICSEEGLEYYEYSYIDFSFHIRRREH
jgi:hypothetical protein